MAKQQQISIPVAPRAVNTFGPFTSGLLPAALVGYQVDFLNDATWPAAGNVVTATVEQSNDSGATWAFDASITLAGGPWFSDRAKTVPSNDAPWSVSLDNQGSATRKVRITIQVLQACGLGLNVSSL
jgi:hypothetical protein